MNILLTGGTGFVGKHLTKQLVNQGHYVYILTRSPYKYENSPLVKYINYQVTAQYLPTIHAVVNLAGDSLFGYWTKRKKERILRSRIESTQKAIDLMNNMAEKPEVFISGSAVGFYGTSERQTFTEDTEQSGDDFLAKVVVEWEQCAEQAEAIGIRTVYMRFGVILGKEGSLPLMMLPIKAFIGGPIGMGKQWLSWVHIDDVVNMISYCIDHEAIKGPVNVTAPNPERNKDFTKTLASVLNRPYWLPVPKLMLRLLIGEMSLLVTKGQYVIPEKAIEHNYSFHYPHLEEALQATISEK
ncbi:TIGR01777 family oxidoreductase [Oceanobacillus halotolerans]|uniref:TIGR01777 family oxidoreductase n=1 Tax=Oceanobacillus halotolerans TaxID=2663380 RepID=UPI0013DB984A|nr:TIGR01777 family oxidoreductase [Oceanobacillus halotolerans]